MRKIDWPNMIVKGIEWFARLAVLNLVWLLFSLPIFTFLPATVAMMVVLKKWRDNDDRDVPVFSLYKQVFFAFFKRSYRMGWPFIIVGIILVINLGFFFSVTSQFSLFFILKNANIFLAFLYLLLFFYSLAVSTFLEGSSKKIIGFAFIMLFSQIGETLRILLYLFLVAVIFNFYPALLFFFSGSVLGMVFLSASEKAYTNINNKTR